MTAIKVLLLRGVNVAGANRLPMQAFRAMLTDLGLAQVQTYIQSGNAVFLDPGIVGLPAAIGAAMARHFGFAPAMVLLDLADYRAVLAANPFAEQGAMAGDKVHLFFLGQAAPAADLAALQALAAPDEAFHLTAAAFYLHAPRGIGRSALAAKLGQVLKVGMTARNQRSAEAILALAQGLKGS